MADKKVIGGLVKLIASLGVDYIEPRLEKALKDGSLTEKLALSPFEAIRESINALSDDDANNEAQVAAIWTKYLHATLRPILMAALEPIVDDIENETDQALVMYLANIGNDIVGIFTDDVQANREQAKAYFESLKTSDETRLVLLNKLADLAGNVVKDKELLKLFITVLNAVFDIVQGKNLDSETSRLLAGETA